MYAVLIQTEKIKHLVYKEKHYYVMINLNDDRIEELIDSFDTYKNSYLSTPIIGMAAFVKKIESKNFTIIEKIDIQTHEDGYLKWIEQKFLNL